MPAGAASALRQIQQAEADAHARVGALSVQAMQAQTKEALEQGVVAEAAATAEVGAAAQEGAEREEAAKAARAAHAQAHMEHVATVQRICTEQDQATAAASDASDQAEKAHARWEADSKGKAELLQAKSAIKRQARSRFESTHQKTVAPLREALAAASTPAQRRSAIASMRGAAPQASGLRAHLEAAEKAEAGASADAKHATHKRRLEQQRLAAKAAAASIHASLQDQAERDCEAATNDNLAFNAMFGDGSAAPLPEHTHTHKQRKKGRRRPWP